MATVSATPAPSLRSCLKRNSQAAHALESSSQSSSNVSRDSNSSSSPSSVSLSLSCSPASRSSRTSRCNSSFSRTVRFSVSEVPVYATHSASEYDRRPSEVGRGGLAHLLGANPHRLEGHEEDSDAPPPGTGAGNAWTMVQTTEINQARMA